MIEILKTFKVNGKITELLSEEKKIIHEDELKTYRNELSQKHNSEIIFTFKNLEK